MSYRTYLDNTKAKTSNTAPKKAMKKPTGKLNMAAGDINEYINMQDKEVQPELQKLRHIIQSAAPDAEEVISYGMPAFKYHGMLVGFAAAKNHYGFYPWTSRTTEQFKKELAAFKTSKGAIQFPKDKPLPAALIKKIVKHRMKENIEKEQLKKLSGPTKN